MHYRCIIMQVFFLWIIKKLEEKRIMMISIFMKIINDTGRDGGYD